MNFLRLGRPSSRVHGLKRVGDLGEEELEDGWCDAAGGCSLQIGFQ